MALDAIKTLLRETTGLHARAVGDTSLERAIRHRMRLREVTRDEDYLRLLRGDPAELDELVEEVVVPETWFFRNVTPFEALATLLPALRGPEASDEELRILSLPCSTGEEPYSIAMVLMDMDPPVGPFSIDAIDISRRAIDKARQAVYGENAFREEAAGIRQRHFRREGDRYRLSPEVRRQVSFACANIITDDFSARWQTYHVIFCRNLLIYFDRTTQARVIDKLRRMLRPGGVLFVGHAEAAQVPRESFEALDLPLSFAFRRRDGEDMPPPPVPAPRISQARLARPETRDWRRRGRQNLDRLAGSFQDLAGLVEKDRQLQARLAARKARQDTAETTVAPATPSPGSGQGDALAEAERFLELGRLGEAARLCEACLESRPDTPQAYYLLGLISHREDSPEAAEVLLRKAVYLDPDHHRAIGLLAELAARRGDQAQAEDYLRRQARARRRREAMTDE